MGLSDLKTGTIGAGLLHLLNLVALLDSVTLGFWTHLSPLSNLAGHFSKGSGVSQLPEQWARAAMARCRFS